MCLITEYIGGGELFDRVIEDEFVLSEKVRQWSSNVLEGGVASTRHRIHDAVSGLLYLHQADPGGSQLHTQHFEFREWLWLLDAACTAFLCSSGTESQSHPISRPGPGHSVATYSPFSGHSNIL